MIGPRCEIYPTRLVLESATTACSNAGRRTTPEPSRVNAIKRAYSYNSSSDFMVVCDTLYMKTVLCWRRNTTFSTTFSPWHGPHLFVPWYILLNIAVTVNIRSIFEAATPFLCMAGLGQAGGTKWHKGCTIVVLLLYFLLRTRIKTMLGTRPNPNL